MSIYNLSVMLYPAENPEKPVNDVPLHLVFLCFHADDVLRIFSAVLMEQRIVFVSNNYALLTTIMEVSEEEKKIERERERERREREREREREKRSGEKREEKG